jgi:hypothetical protein
MALMVVSMEWLRARIERMVGNKFDCIIFVEGNRGLGKSTFVYKLVNGLIVPIPFKPKRDLVYSRTDTLRHLATKKGGVIFSDEMINVAYNRDFYENEQKTLLKALNMYRDSCNVFVGCIPKFVELDKQIQRLCKIRITIVRRGLALLQTQNPSIYQSDSWDIKNNQKIESKWTLKGVKNPKYSQLTTMRALIRFGDLSPNQRDEYEAIKQEKRSQVFGEYQDGQLLYENPEKIFYDNLVKQALAGKVTKETWDALAIINTKKQDEMRVKFNQYLKQSGSQKTFRDLIFTSKEHSKRDKLGFVIKSSEQAFDLFEPTPENNQSKNDGQIQDKSDKEKGGQGDDEIFNFKN